MGFAEALRKYLPCHPQSTVDAIISQVEIKQIAIESLKEINREFLIENQRLEKVLDDAQEEARKLRGVVRLLAYHLGYRAFP